MKDLSVKRGELAQPVALFLLPTLATVALYLPGGLLMPARWAMVALTGFALWRLWCFPAARTSPVLWGTAGVCAVVLLFGLIGLARYGGEATALAQVGFALVAICAMAVLGQDRAALGWLLWGWLASAAIAGIVGGWEILTGNHMPGNAPARQWAGVIDGWNVISSFFDNPNLYAYHCVVVLVLLPALHLLTRARPCRVAVVAAAPLVVVLLLWTSGRMALIAAAVGVTVWALFWRWGRWLWAAGVASLVATMLLDLPPGRQVVAAARMLIENLQWGELTSSGTRLQLIRAGWWMTQQSGYLGVGPGRFPQLASDPSNPYVAEFTNPHFGLVELLAEYGLICLLAVLVGLAAGGVLAVRTLRRTDHTAARALSIAALALLTVTPLLTATHSTWLGQPLAAVHLATLVGLLAAARREAQQ